MRQIGVLLVGRTLVEASTVITGNKGGICDCDYLKSSRPIKITGEKSLVAAMFHKILCFEWKNQ